MSIPIAVVTMVADALKDVTIGVNAQLARFQGITVGGTPDTAPATITGIYDEFRDDRVMSKEPPPDIPAIYVMRDGALTLEGEVGTVYRDTERSFGVKIVLFSNESRDDMAKSLRYTEYYLRAIIECLKQWLDNDNAAAMRNSLGVQVIQSMGLIASPLREQINNAIVTGFVGILLYIRDTAP